MCEHEDARTKLEELAAAHVPVKIPAMALLEPHPFIPMSAEISTLGGRRIGRGDVTGLKTKKGDAAIGATAEIEGEPVLTRNVDGFAAFGFDVETY